jgi:hypothetical protein
MNKPLKEVINYYYITKLIVDFKRTPKEKDFEQKKNENIEETLMNIEDEEEIQMFEYNCKNKNYF